MARTINDIYTSIIAEKDSLSTLSGLTPAGDSLASLISDLGSSPSKVAIWRLWCYIIAVAHWMLEQLWDRQQANIEQIIANQQGGVLRWYQEIGLEFQYGDPLVYANGKWGYAAIDLTKQIVTRCAALEFKGILIKAAKSVGGNTVKLTAPELLAFSAYMKKRKWAGPSLQCISYDPDTLKLYLTVYFDPLYDLPSLTAAVEAAIQSFIDRLPFNGLFNLTKLIDAIQAVPGVIDPRLDTCYSTSGTLPYTAIVGEFNPVAGYCIIDPAFPLSSTITYQPYV